MRSTSKKRWTDEEVEKLRSMAGNRSLLQIALVLARPTRIGFDKGPRAETISEPPSA